MCYRDHYDGTSTIYLCWYNIPTCIGSMIVIHTCCSLAWYRTILKLFILTASYWIVLRWFWCMPCCLGCNLIINCRTSLAIYHSDITSCSTGCITSSTSGAAGSSNIHDLGHPLQCYPPPPQAVSDTISSLTKVPDTTLILLRSANSKWSDSVTGRNKLASQMVVCDTWQWGSLETAGGEMEFNQHASQMETRACLLFLR